MSEETLEEYKKRLRARTKEMAEMPYGEKAEEGVKEQKSDMQGVGATITGTSLIAENVIHGVGESKKSEVADKYLDRAKRRMQDKSKAQDIFHEMSEYVDPSDPEFREMVKAKNEYSTASKRLASARGEKPIDFHKDFEKDYAKWMKEKKISLKEKAELHTKNLSGRYDFTGKFKEKNPTAAKFTDTLFKQDDVISDMVSNELTNKENRARNLSKAADVPLGVGDAIDEVVDISKKAKYAKYASRLGGLAGVGMMLTNPAEAADPSAWTPLGPSSPTGDDSPERIAVEEPITQKETILNPGKMSERLRREKLKRRLKRFK